MPHSWFYRHTYGYADLQEVSGNFLCMLSTRVELASPVASDYHSVLVTLHLFSCIYFLLGSNIYAWLGFIPTIHEYRVLGKNTPCHFLTTIVLTWRRIQLRCATVTTSFWDVVVDGDVIRDCDVEGDVTKMGRLELEQDGCELM